MTTEQEHIILDNYKTKTITELAVLAKVAKTTVKAFLSRHDLEAKKIAKPIGEAEYFFIKDNYKKRTAAEIGAIVGRSARSIQSLAYREGWSTRNSAV